MKYKRNRSFKKKKEFETKPKRLVQLIPNQIENPFALVRGRALWSYILYSIHVEAFPEKPVAKVSDFEGI